ncbi:rod shape-determining protein MreC, partial [Myxococcota bacterium]|nr:rod shape-determining protein MreC [Myxococcota bacterium]
FAILLLALPFLFYLANTKEPADHNFLDRAIVRVSAPVQWIITVSMGGVSDVWHHYFALVGVQEENARLHMQNAELRAELNTRAEDKAENERLRRMLRLRERARGMQVLSARVVAVSPSLLFRSIRVDRGSNDGIELGSAVVTHEGVVGRVAALSGEYSDIMLLADANSSLDVLIQRTRARGRLRGKGVDGVFSVQVDYLERTADVQPGDVLITSGLGTVFPKGLRVGVVTEIDRASYGLFQYAEIKPHVDFTRIEEVMILSRRWPPEISFESEPESEEDSKSEPVDPAL